MACRGPGLFAGTGSLRRARGERVQVSFQASFLLRTRICNTVSSSTVLAGAPHDTARDGRILCFFLEEAEHRGRRSQGLCKLLFVDRRRLF